MKAATLRRYGPPETVRIEDLPDPRPGRGEIVVRVRAASVSAADWRIRTMSLPRGMGWLGRPIFGWRGPRRPILGTECAGTVEAVGEGVTEWRVGDGVIGYVGARMGCHAERVALPAAGAVIPLPGGLDWAEAGAFSFGGTTALSYLRDGGKLQAGQSLMLIGASGSVGHAALQIAVAMGARVTTVTSAAHLPLMEAGGAARAIDYAATDIATLPDRFDLIMDCVGVETWARMRPRLTPAGRFLMVAADLPQMLHAAVARGQARPVSLIIGEKRSDLEALAALHAAGRYTPHVSARFPLAEAAAAHARVETRHKTGNVVLTMD